MAELIRVTPQEMKASAGRVNGQIDQWTTEVQAIKNAVGEMTSFWEGEGSQEFINMFTNSDEPMFRELADLMDRYEEIIRLAAEAYLRGEDEVRGIVKTGVSR